MYELNFPGKIRKKSWQELDTNLVDHRDFSLSNRRNKRMVALRTRERERERERKRKRERERDVIYK